MPSVGDIVALESFQDLVVLHLYQSGTVAPACLLQVPFRP
jgi:hypothetical protein